MTDLGEPTHTLIPCWMSKPLPPRNECTGCFAPSVDDLDLDLVVQVNWDELTTNLGGTRFHQIPNGTIYP